MEDQKLNFIDTERGKVIFHGIHDHNGGMGIIGGTLSLIKNSLESGEDIPKEVLLQYVDMMSKGIKRSQDSIDYIYSEIKRLENL